MTGPIELGRRATALRTIYNEALTHTIKTVSYDRFIACFPTPARYCPESLKGVWKQMMSRFEELARVGPNSFFPFGLGSHIITIYAFSLFSLVSWIQNWEYWDSFLA